MEKAAKTVGYHADDGAYNTSTIQSMKNAKDDIEYTLRNATGEKKAMLKHYKDAIDEIEKAMAKKEAPAKEITQYVLKPKKAKDVARARRRDFKVRRDSGIDFKVAKFKDGTGKVGTRTNRFSSTEAYTIDAGEGIEIKFFPNDGSFSEARGRALHGISRTFCPFFPIAKES